MTQTPIVFGQVQNPYREFTLTIPAGEYRDIPYAFNYFRIMSLTGSGLKVRFGGSGEYTSIIGAGFGLELPQAIQRVFFQNDSVNPLTVTVGLAIGKISDDRANVSGTVNVDIIGQSGADPLKTADAAVLAMMQNMQAKVMGVNDASAATFHKNNTAGVTTVFAPAANTNGFILYHAKALPISGSAAAFIYVDTAAPSTYYDVTKYML